MSTATSTRRRIYPGLDQLVLRSLVVVGTLTAVVAAQAAGARPGTWHLVVLLSLALLTALRPESPGGVLLLCGAAYTWSLAPQTLSALVLLAAAGMLLAHLSALVVAQGPARMQVDPAQVRLWALRGLVLWASAAAVWAMAVAMAGLAERRTAYALGLIVLIGLAVWATVRISTSCSTASDPKPSRPSRSGP